MATFLKLLGPPRAVRDGVEIDIPWQKGTALLLYLACRGDWVGRDELIALVRPDEPESDARRYLRGLLHRIRAFGWADGVEVESDRLRWDVPTDVAAFREAASGRGLREAAERRGVLLEGMGAVGIAGLDDWFERERDELRALWRSAALSRSRELAEGGRPGEATPLLEALLDDDPLDEDAVQALLRCARGGTERRRALIAFERFRSALAAEMALEPLQATAELADRLRRDPGDELPEPERARVEVERDVVPSQAPPVAPPSRGPVGSGLPQVLTSFVAREEALREVAELLDRDSCRLLTLVGPGGIGKSRLALQVASAREGRYPDGVHVVSLTDTDTREALVAAVASALGRPLQGDVEAGLLAYLADRSLLLCLDNVEQLVPHASWFTDVLARAPGVRMLLTSREALGLHVEWLYPVAGLGYPSSGEAVEVGRYGALQLFVRTADRLGAGVDPEDVPAVARICRLVDGAPLAIELAASWTRLLGPAEIAAELERDLGFLDGAARDLPTRHHSMRAVFEASWRLLSPRQQEALAALSAFRGGFERRAAERVAGASARALLELAGKSLLRRLPSGRFDLHPLIRQFATEKLGEGGEGPKLEERFQRHFLAELAGWRTDIVSSREQQRMTERMVRDFENHRKAWLGAIRDGRTELVDEASDSYWMCLVWSNRFHEGRQIFGESLTLLGDESDRALRSRIEASLGALSIRLSDYDEARRLLEGSLEHLEAPHHRAFALSERSHLAYIQGEYPQAHDYEAEVLEIYRRLDSQAGEMRSLTHLGITLWTLGDYDRAEEHYQRALAIADRLGVHHMKAHLHRSLSNIATTRGDHQRARELLESSLLGFREVNDQNQAAMTQRNLSHTLGDLGDLEGQLENARQALAAYQSLAMPNEVAIGHLSVASALLACGDGPEARDHLCRGLRIALEIDAVPTALRLLKGFAGLRAGDHRGEALALLLFTAGHPTTRAVHREDSERRLEELEPDADELRLARERAARLELVPVAHRLLADQPLF